MSSTAPNYPADPQWENNEPPSPDSTELNETFNVQESSMQELKSLARSLAAESGMARLSATRWADLRRCARVDHAPGQWQISSPEQPETPAQVVTLTWQPGSMLMCESYGEDAPTLSLPLPPVRPNWQWDVPPKNLPPRPGPPPQWASPEQTAERDRAEATRRAAWQRHLAPILAEAQQQRDADQTQAQADEETLAVAAMRMVQARRLDPEGAERTLAEELDEIAAPMRA